MDINNDMLKAYIKKTVNESIQEASPKLIENITKTIAEQQPKAEGFSDETRRKIAQGIRAGFVG